MPIPVQDTLIEHVGNGVTTVFSYPFTILSSDDLKCRVNGALVTSGFTVSGVGSRTGGSVTFSAAPASLASVLLYRQVSLDRETDYQENGDLLASVIDDDFDRAWMAIQDLGALNERSLRVPVGEVLDDLPGAESRADRILGFNSLGEPIMVTRTEDGGSALALDLASTSDASKGSGMSGHVATLNYAAGTIGAVLNDVCLNVRMFPWLAAGDGVTNDYPAISAALAVVNASGGRLLIPGGKTYNLAGNTLTITGANVTIDGYGATLLNTRITTTTAATGTTILGLRILDNTSSSGAYLLDLAGTRFTVQDVTIEKSPVAGGVMAYLRRQSSFGSFRNLRTFGSNGIFISGHDHTFTGCQLESKGLTLGAGTDDAYVLKAGDSSGATVETYNINIIGGTVRGFFNVLAIGSEVGRYAADGDYSSFVRNVTVTGVTAYRCVSLAYIKPGAIGNDYRHGLVENINVSNCTLLDDGLGFIYWGIAILAGRGAIIRNVQFSDCIIRGRCDGTSVTHAGLFVSGVNVGASATIQDVTIDNLQVFDTFDGVANDVSHPGQPFLWGAYIQRVSAANDTIRRIKIKGCQFRGTQDGGIGFENAPQGPVEIDGVDLLETGINPSAGIYRGLFGLTSSTDCVVRNLVVSTSSSQLPVGASDFAASSEQAIVDIGSSAAGSNISHMLWVAPKDCHIWKIELVDSAGIVQSDVDYIRFDLRNKNTGADLPAFTTKVTGGYALPAFTPVAMSPTSYTTDEAYLPKGKALQVITTNTGAGKALTAMKVVIYYVPYGR